MTVLRNEYHAKIIDLKGFGFIQNTRFLYLSSFAFFYFVEDFR